MGLRWMCLTFAFVSICGAALKENVQILHKGRLTKAAQTPETTHPAVRSFTAGTKFMFAVLNSHLDDADNSYTENITLIVTNYDTTKTAEILVTSPFETFVNGKFYVQPLQTYQFALPADIQTNYRDLDVGRAVKANKSLTVTSTGAQVSLVVRNMHSDGMSEDDYVIYPVCALGKSYRPAADNSVRKGQQSTNMWAIVATQDNTVVSIYPPLLAGTVTLNTGEVLTMASDKYAFTNYRIDATNPVAVISGAVCGFGYYNPQFCNHEALMMFPLADAATDFPYSQFISEDRGEFMIFGTKDNTRLFLDGVYFDTLDDHEYYIFGYPGSVYVTTSLPSYMVAVSSIRSDAQGSPFMAHIPATTQFTNQQYIQVTTGLPTRAKTSNYIRIQTTIDSVGKLSVDGWTISPLFYKRQGKGTIYMAEFPVQPGNHVVQSSDSNVRYAVTVYGFTHFTAYAYTPGIDLPTTGTC